MILQQNKNKPNQNNEKKMYQLKNMKIRMKKMYVVLIYNQYAINYISG